MKKGKIFFTIIIVVSILFILLLNVKRFSIDEAPSKYSLRTYDEQKSYTNFISKYIYPTKLNNFLNTDHISFSIVRNFQTGNDAIAWFKYEAYTELFNRMFDKNRNSFDDCPVTNDFKNKFSDNLFKYFKFTEANDSSIECAIDDKEKTIDVIEAGDFIAGEPDYIFYHHFHYTLDDEGNVDDVIFDYTEE